jgi:hypothetical protein
VDEPWPYDPPPPGVKSWVQRFPNKGPDRTPAPDEEKTGPDGIRRTFRTGLRGLAPPAPRSPDEMVRDWAPL